MMNRGKDGIENIGTDHSSTQELNRLGSFPKIAPSSDSGAESGRDKLFRIPAWKRILDLTCIAISLPCWLPLMVLIAVCIQLISPGPVFFRQERVGYMGRRFTCLKFRSMKVNAETRSHERHLEELIYSDSPMTKLDAAGDPRLIPFGRIFRATGLDELPQIINIIRGEMSIVGPRPCTTNEFEHYNECQLARLNTLPGLTGYWQVSGKNRTTFSEMIAMDIYYANKMSLWMDIGIMLKTVPAIMGQVLGSHRWGRSGKKENEAYSGASLNKRNE